MVTSSEDPLWGEEPERPRCPLGSQEPLGAVRTQTPASGAPAWRTWAFKNIIHQVMPETVYKTLPRQAHETGQSTLKSIFQGWWKRKKKSPKHKTKPS